MLLAGAAFPASAYGQCVINAPAVDACLGGVRNAGPAGATLDLNFMFPGTLDPRITFTRASSATYTDASGVVQMAATNAPRWDYANGVLRGLLIEEQRTNIALQSSTSVAPWQAFGTVVVAPTWTPNNAIAPDGTTTASRTVFPAVSGVNAASILFQTITLTAVPYVFSVYLKGNVGGEQVYIGANASPYARSLVTLTTQWQRFSVPITGTAANWNFKIGTDLSDAGQTTTAASTVYVWGAQVEQGAFPTSYIPTASVAVTRAADVASISPANMVPWFAPSGGSWFAEFDYTTNPLTNSRVIGQPVPSGLTPLFMRTTNAGSQFDGGLSDTITTTTANVINKMVSTWMPGQAKIALNAGPVTTTAALTTGYGVLATSGINIFTTASSGPDNLSGHIRRVTYWNRALSDTEMQQVTT